MGLDLQAWMSLDNRNQVRRHVKGILGVANVIKHLAREYSSTPASRLRILSQTQYMDVQKVRNFKAVQVLSVQILNYCSTNP